MAQIAITSADLGLLMPLIAEAGIDTRINKFRYADEILHYPDSVAADVAAITVKGWQKAGAKAILYAYNANARFKAENAGVAVLGMTFQTDRQTQMMLTNAIVYLQTNPSATIQWKVSNGKFMSLNNTQVAAAAQAVTAHIQACFAMEGKNTIAIAAETITTQQQIDTAYATIT